MSRTRVALKIDILAIAIFCIGPVQARLQIDSAYWQQDILATTGSFYQPNYEWTDGFAGLEEFPEQGKQAGTVHIFVINESGQPAAPQVTSAKPVGGDELLGTLELVWQRCLPQELAPGGIGQISVRLRNPQQNDLVVTVTTEGAPPQTVPVSVELLPFRLQTLAWSEQGREVFLVAQATAPDPSAIRRVWLDGKDVTGRCRLLAPDFFAGVSPIVLRPESPLQRGCIHTYMLEDAQGRKVGWNLRTVDVDGFVPLGIYEGIRYSRASADGITMLRLQPGDLDTITRLGFNALGLFCTDLNDRSLLDRFAAYGVRSFHYTNHEPFIPEPEIRGHPTLYCYAIHDEPDVSDSRRPKDIPMNKRIGYMAPEMIRRYAMCRQVDPVTPAALIVNLSLAPTNYYTYGQIADLFLPDNYPLTHRWQMSRVFETTRYSWWAAGPRPVQSIMQVNYEDRPGEMKYRRPPLAEEMYLQFLYSLAAGARGFWGFMWPSEGARPRTIFHGPGEYPDVQAALLHAHMTLGPLLPLINRSHPISLATTDDPQVKLATLLGGPDALLVAVINKTVESLVEDFRYRILRNVEVRIPSTPWLQPGFVGEVDAGTITPLPLQREEDGISVVLPEVKAGALLLAGADAGLAHELERDYRVAAARADRRMIAAMRRDIAGRGEHHSALRRIAGRYAQFRLLAAETYNVEGVTVEDFWPVPVGEHNGIKWETEEHPRGGRWELSVPAEHAGRPYTIHFGKKDWWRDSRLQWQVLDASGEIVAEGDRISDAGLLPAFQVTFPHAGTYQVKILDVAEKNSGGQLSRVIYALPASVLGKAHGSEDN